MHETDYFSVAFFFFSSFILLKWTGLFFLAEYTMALAVVQAALDGAAKQQQQQHLLEQQRKRTAEPTNSRSRQQQHPLVAVAPSPSCRCCCCHRCDHHHHFLRFCLFFSLFSPLVRFVRPSAGHFPLALLPPSLSSFLRFFFFFFSFFFFSFCPSVFARSLIGRPLL